MNGRSRTRSLKYAIGMAFLILTLIIILNSVLGIAGLYRSSKILAMTAKVESMAKLATSTETHLRGAGYLLLDFSLYKDIQLVEKGQEELNITIENIKQMISLVDRTGAGDPETVRNLLTKVNLFNENYKKYVETVRETGLNEDSGLQGSFRTSAHQLEEFFKSINRDDLSVEYLMLRRHEKDFLLRKNQKYINEVEASVADLQNSVSRLPVSREDKDSAEELLTSYLEEFLALSALTMKEENLIDEQNKMIAEIVPILENGVKQMGIQVEKSLEAAVRIRRLLLTVMFTVIGISILTALLISISIFRRLRAPLKTILSVTDAMADGRLDQRAGLTRMDEMGQIGANIDKAAENISNLIQALQTAADDGAALSDRLGSVAEETAAAITEISANIESIDKRTNDMDRTARSAGTDVSEIVERLEDLNRAATDQSASVTQSTASIEEMVASIKNVNEISDEKNRSAEELTLIAEESRNSVKQTGDLVEEITKLTESTLEVISVINAVASRTNLLAMNAAIEAAHAGDAGRGFSVVADEIRKLAESTGNNAKSINESLGAMVSKIKMVKTASQSSIDAMEKMAVDVKGFTRSFAEISSSMSEMSIGSQEVLNASEALSMLTQNLNHAIGDMSEKAVTASSGMDTLVNLVDQVSSGITEIGRAGNDINSAANTLSSDGMENRSIINRIRELADKFSVRASE